MSVSISSLDNTSHPSLAIVSFNDGRKGKFPKVRPPSADASDTAWQTRAQTEITNACNQTMAGSASNATATLAALA